MEAAMASEATKMAVIDNMHKHVRVFEVTESRQVSSQNEGGEADDPAPAAVGRGRQLHQRHHSVLVEQRLALSCYSVMS